MDERFPKDVQNFIANAFSIWEERPARSEGETIH